MFHHELEEDKLVELKKFSLSERIIKRGIDILGRLVGSFISHSSNFTLCTL
jgi:hypothetical protein